MDTKYRRMRVTEGDIAGKFVRSPRAVYDGRDASAAHRNGARRWHWADSANARSCKQINSPSPGYIVQVRGQCADIQVVNILVVDDDRVCAEVLRKMIEAQGHRVSIAADGQDAWDLLEDATRYFDLIYVDLSMPEVDGFELVARLRSSPVLRTTDVIVCTASRDTPSFRRALALGVHDYVLKPPSPARVAKQLALAEHRRSMSVPPG